MERLAILGSGGYGREIRWLVDEINAVQPAWQFLGFLDDTKPSGTAISPEGKVLGPLEMIADLGDVHAVCAIANPSDRRSVVERLEPLGVQWASLIAPSAILGPGAKIGVGLILNHFAGLSIDTRVGNHVHIHSSAAVGHDARLGDFCTVSSYAHICGHADLGEGAFIGSHGVVLQHARVGNWATVGAGSVALRHVPDHAKIFGVPPQRID